MMKLVFSLLAVLLFARTVPAADATPEQLANWHQWRGPLATGFAPHGDPPIRWDETTNMKWKAALPGKGSSTPIVWGDQVFVLTAIDTGRTAAPADLPKIDPKFEVKTKAPANYHQFVVLSFDRATGKERWRRVATEQVPHEGHHPSHSYAAGSPTTDGKYLYVSFGSFGVYCYDLSGKLQWQRDLGRLHTRLGWGEAQSPVVHGDTLIVNVDQEANSFLIALDVRTGETRWRVERDEPTSWATPAIISHKGRTQAIVSATNRVRSYDMATGELIWQCGGQTINVIPSPVLFGDHVICVSGYRGAFACSIPLDATGDLTKSDRITWQYDKGTPYVPSPLLVGDQLYFTHMNNPILTCLDASTGKPIFESVRLPRLATLYGSPTAAAGRIYLSDRDGTTLVFKPSDPPEVLATNKLEDALDASPVIVGKTLYLRGEKFLYCIEAP